MAAQSKVEMAKPHVREAEAHIVRQQEIIEQLRSDGHPTLEAELSLKVFQDTLRSHKQSLSRLQAASKD